MRDADVSGVSGTGHVAEGVQFASGKVVLSWLAPTSSVAVYDGVADVEKIHGHEGKTRVVWVDDEPGREPRWAYPHGTLGGSNYTVTVDPSRWQLWLKEEWV